MFRLYEAWCEETIDGKKRAEADLKVSEFIYRQTFHRDFNLGFFLPKKDQCATCIRKTLLKGDELEVFLRQVLEPHLKRKQEAAAEKEADKDNAKNDPSYRSINFDLQSVLYTPCSAVGTLYYKRKLAVYNLTVYEQVSHRGFCYLWNETVEKRGSNEIGSCILKYLHSLPDTVNRVSMYSDTCAGQNRNSNIASMLLHAVVNSGSLEIIDHKFLESGHSYMEVDSIHAAIEHSRKNAVASAENSDNTVVRIPQDWETIITTARKKKDSQPYHVNFLEQKEIKDLKKLCAEIMQNKTRNTEGEKMENYSDGKFRELKIVSEGSRRSTLLASNVSLDCAYSQLFPISTAKYEDLMSLVSGPNSVVDPFYAAYYRNLPHNPRVADVLPEPADGEDDAA